MPVPLHEQIRADIEAKILSGELVPGDHIPIEHELTRIYGCARMTVNKAVSALATAGLVERRKRHGTVVAKPRVHSMVLDVPDLAQEVVARGHAYRWELVSRRVRQPQKSDPGEQELANAGRLLEVHGVHFSNGKPLALERRIISLATVPESANATFDQNPPGSWLLLNVPWTEAETRIAALEADMETAERLQSPAGMACLMIERRTWRGTDPVTRVQQIFDGSRYDLFARFGHDDFRTRTVR
ncbi:histidine utilization repressor [Sphingobium sp. SCG-1]|uniref:histidine utilization repressor n=1 Tax=Sphingobium sp. SCG-1 TaxID=2072936 RepID=UPI000CD67D4A|nr:histidine utilization repressor [Sphingobium sp. SCG-1]AUW59769.1 histidine utilization repressor [Sphingobium sp. SCG-1]